LIYALKKIFKNRYYMTKFVKYTLKNAFNKNYKTKFPPSYPNEMMVKILSSSYYSKIIPKKFFDKKNKVIEVGSSSGNNLRFFIDKKFDTHGIEINKDMVKFGKKNLKRMGYKIPKIKIGHNTKIPYPNNYFDCLVSINTLHYSSGDDVDKALKEYKRVVKKGSIVYIETSGPKHFSRKSSSKISALKWKWKSRDFRNNFIFGFFSSKKQFKKALEKNFSHVELFERSEYSKIDLHFYIGICRV
jgi:ubiquinone/menaquinone biosynthesis C-methylase UbiE